MRIELIVFDRKSQTKHSFFFNEFIFHSALPARNVRVPFDSWLSIKRTDFDNVQFICIACGENEFEYTHPFIDEVICKSCGCEFGFSVINSLEAFNVK